MGNLRLRYLSRDISENIERHYVRVPGRRKVRLWAEEGSLEFMAEYHAAIAGAGIKKDDRPRPTTFAPHTLGRAILDYYTSAAFEMLGPSRQRSRRLILNKIAAANGNEMVRAITKRVIQLGLDRRASTPAAANEYLKALRTVFDYLVRVDEVKENPAKQVAYITIKTDGFHTWSIEEVLQFIDHHAPGSQAVLALGLLLFTGQRRGDVIRMGPQHVENGFIVLRQRKTATKLLVPILPPLRAIIDQTKIGNLTYIVTAFGKPFSDAGFGNRFREWCDAADLKHCTAHGLRKAGATIAAQLGASDRELMALFGWSDPRQVTTYTRVADQKRLATEAAERIASVLKVNRFVPPKTEVAPQRDNQRKKQKDISG